MKIYINTIEIFSSVWFLFRKWNLKSFSPQQEPRRVNHFLELTYMLTFVLFFI